MMGVKKLVCCAVVFFLCFLLLRFLISPQTIEALGGRGGIGRGGIGRGMGRGVGCGWRGCGYHGIRSWLPWIRTRLLWRRRILRSNPRLYL